VRHHADRFVVGQESGTVQRVGDEDMVRALTWAPDGSSLVIARLAARSAMRPRLLRVPLDGSPAEDLLCRGHGALRGDDRGHPSVLR
jgi:hypothetical protein